MFYYMVQHSWNPSILKSVGPFLGNQNTYPVVEASLPLGLSPVELYVVPLMANAENLMLCFSGIHWLNCNNIL